MMRARVALVALVLVVAFAAAAQDFLPVQSGSGGSGTDASAFHNGGDDFGAAARLGTNDAYALEIETDGTLAMSIDTSQIATCYGEAVVVDKDHNGVTYLSAANENNSASSSAQVTAYAGANYLFQMHQGGSAWDVSGSDARDSGAAVLIAYQNIPMRFAAVGNGGFTWTKGFDMTTDVLMSMTSGGALTFTGGATFSGVSTDVTTGTNEDFVVDTNGTGAFTVISNSSGVTINLADNGNTTRSRFFTSSSRGFLGWYTGNNAAVTVEASAAKIGRQGSQSSNTVTGCISEAISVSSAATDLVCAYGDGALGIVLQQSITIADDGAGTSPVDTTSPTSSHVEVTCSDTDGCVYRPGETSVVDGWAIAIVNVGSNTVTISDSAGVVRARGGSIALAADDSASCNYTGSIWSCR
jgi:hypothetical protein